MSAPEIRVTIEIGDAKYGATFAPKPGWEPKTRASAIGDAIQTTIEHHFNEFGKAEQK